MATTVYPPQGTYRGFGESLGEGLGQGISQMVGAIVQGQQQMKMQEATRVREQANKIITSMRKNPAMKNRLAEYDEWINPTETEGVIPMRKAEAAPKEGSTAWAREVVKRFGDVASPAEELESEMVDLKRRAMKLIKLQGEGTPQPGQVPGPGPGLGGGQGLGLGLKGGPGPGGGPMGTPQQRGISPGVVLGFEKPTDPFKMLELQLDQLGLLDDKTRTMILGLRAKVATMAEERAGKEFKVEQKGRAADRVIKREQLLATRTNNIYERLRRRLDDLDSYGYSEEKQLLEGVKARTDAVGQLQSFNPEQAKREAPLTADYVISRIYELMALPGMADRPEFKALIGDLKREIKTLYGIAGLPVRKVVQDRWNEMAKLKDKTPEEEAFTRVLGDMILEKW